MLTKPVSILPCMIFSLAGLVCFGIYAGIIPGWPDWLRVFTFYLVFMAGLFAVVSGGVYLADHVVRLANMRGILHPEARICEAIKGMNRDQILLVATLTNCETESTGPAPDPELIPLITGDRVEARAIERIADNVTGDELRPERSYHVDRDPIRRAHDALAGAAIITPARGRAAPRILDRNQFNQILNLAKGRR